ncbi:MAG: hypothetical protein AAF787_22945 [Chloroflexota bacterium]
MSWEWALVIGVGVLALLCYGFIRVDRAQKRLDAERHGIPPRKNPPKHARDSYQIHRDMEMHLLHTVKTPEIIALIESGEIDAAVEATQAITGATEFMAREFVEGQVRRMQRGR